MVDRVATLMAQQHAAPLRCSPFHFHHLVELESLEPWMRKIKRNGNCRHAFGREPFVSQVAIRTQGNSARTKLVIELSDAPLKLASLNAHTKIADADIQ